VLSDDANNILGFLQLVPPRPSEANTVFIGILLLVALFTNIVFTVRTSRLSVR